MLTMATVAFIYLYTVVTRCDKFRRCHATAGGTGARSVTRRDISMRQTCAINNSFSLRLVWRTWSHEAQVAANHFCPCDISQINLILCDMSQGQFFFAATCFRYMTHDEICPRDMSLQRVPATCRSV